MAPKLNILLYVYSKQPHYNTVSLITRSASLDPIDSIIMRLYCTTDLFDYQNQLKEDDCLTKERIKPGNREKCLAYIKYVMIT